MERHPQPNVFDFSPEFLNMAIHLMLAQAQECFYEKAVKDNMKASIIAKLAAQVADYYEFTLTLVTNSALSSIVPKVSNNLKILQLLIILFFKYLELGFSYSSKNCNL